MAAQPAPSDQGREHARLINVATTRCITCHKKLLQGRQTIHPPASEGCLDSHAFAVAETGTRVSLSSPEPAFCLACHDVARHRKVPGRDVATEACSTCHDPHGTSTAHLLREREREISPSPLRRRQRQRPRQVQLPHRHRCPLLQRLPRLLQRLRPSRSLHRFRHRPSRWRTGRRVAACSGRGATRRRRAPSWRSSRRRRKPSRFSSSSRVRRRRCRGPRLAARRRSSTLASCATRGRSAGPSDGAFTGARSRPAPRRAESPPGSWREA
ncbi:MAG: hypothetical protein IPP07_13680 [Holophagales bacterium]|nr:hypothetical protein [Holophagales bacterium]